MRSTRVIWGHIIWLMCGYLNYLSYLDYLRYLNLNGFIFRIILIILHILSLIGAWWLNLGTWYGYSGRPGRGTLCRNFGYELGKAHPFPLGYPVPFPKRLEGDKLFPFVDLTSDLTSALPSVVNMNAVPDKLTLLTVTVKLLVKNGWLIAKIEI